MGVSKMVLTRRISLWIEQCTDVHVCVTHHQSHYEVLNV